MSEKLVQKIVVSGVLMNDEGKILLAKRPETKKIAPGKYHLPGGHVEFGETAEEAIAREFFEELQLVIINLQFLRTYTYVIGDTHTVGITYKVQVQDLPTNIYFDPQDTESLSWIGRKELDAVLGPDDHDYSVLDLLLDL